jgi:hypothetical protein
MTIITAGAGNDALSVCRAAMDIKPFLSVPHHDP